MLLKIKIYRGGYRLAGGPGVGSCHLAFLHLSFCLSLDRLKNTQVWALNICPGVSDPFLARKSCCCCHLIREDQSIGTYISKIWSNTESAVIIANAVQRLGSNSHSFWTGITVKKNWDYYLQIHFLTTVPQVSIAELIWQAVEHIAAYLKKDRLIKMTLHYSESICWIRLSTGKVINGYQRKFRLRKNKEILVIRSITFFL